MSCPGLRLRASSCSARSIRQLSTAHCMLQCLQYRILHSAVRQPSTAHRTPRCLSTPHRTAPCPSSVPRHCGIAYDAIVVPWHSIQCYLSIAGHAAASKHIGR
eukprot:2852208-Rhodomonas_salina.4